MGLLRQGKLRCWVCACGIHMFVIVYVCFSGFFRVFVCASEGLTHLLYLHLMPYLNLLIAVSIGYTLCLPYYLYLPFSTHLSVMRTHSPSVPVSVLISLSLSLTAKPIHWPIISPVSLVKDLLFFFVCFFFAFDHFSDLRAVFEYHQGNKMFTHGLNLIN